MVAVLPEPIIISAPRLHCWKGLARIPKPCVPTTRLTSVRTTSSRRLHSHHFDENMDQVIGNYKIGRTVGQGSFGVVKIAEHLTTGHSVAIKVLNRHEMGTEREEKVMKEVKKCSLFVHPHIVRINEVFETPTDSYVVMEYVRCGNLFDHVMQRGKLQEDEGRKIFQQIFSGVEFCHRNKVIHGNLKADNILLDSRGYPKIADFGLYKLMRDCHFREPSVNPRFAAPEVVSGKLYAWPGVDVWSLGIILYFLLCGTLPFDDEDLPDLLFKIKNGFYDLPNHMSIGPKDLISRCLFINPRRRITIPEIRHHPWFKAQLPSYLADDCGTIVE